MKRKTSTNPQANAPSLFEAPNETAQAKVATGMKCLSVRQPWASLICMGVKDVENRSWRVNDAPGRILIHASSYYDRYAQGEAEDIVGHPLPPLPLGAIIGYVEVYAFTRHSDSEWADEDSSWKWLLRNPHLFKTPIPYRGRMGLFDVVEIATLQLATSLLISKSV